MQISEPTTMLTDYALAALTLVLAVFLNRAGRVNRQISIRLWATAFIAAAIAALAGGTSHGFALHLGENMKTALWKATVYSIGLASCFMLSGTILASISRPLSKWLLAVVVLKFIGYAEWMATHDEFRYVIYDYAPAMLGVIILQSYSYYSGREASAKWIIAGIFVSFVAAGIQQSGFTIHKHFNYNDLYHVIQMGATYLFYKGALLFRDQN